MMNFKLKKVTAPVVLLTHSALSVFVGAFTKIMYKSYAISNTIMLLGIVGLLLSIFWLYSKLKMQEAA
jgi:hypothetical protein